jgi:hypothetical protein
VSTVTNPVTDDKAVGPNAWQQRAKELARWAWSRYVIRTDVWGGYNEIRDRKRKSRWSDGTEHELGPTRTCPRKHQRGIVELDLDFLERHFRGAAVSHVVGVHATSPDNISKFGCVEIDVHTDEAGDSNDPAMTVKAATAWYDRLVARGFRPLLWESNGKGGFHLDLLFAAPIATPNLYWYLRELVADHAAYKLTARPETFPKQARVNPNRDGKGHYGNWCRLIGRHHTRDVWATVWNGSQWLQDAAAVDFVLSLTGDPPSLVPVDTEVSARITAYMRKLPHLSEGQGRDDIAFNLLAFLTRDLNLPDEEALKWASEWDAGNTPPKGPERLREVLANAHQYGKRAYGSGRNGDETTVPAAAPPEPPRKNPGTAPRSSSKI